jgi:hypothetical protein
MLKSRFETAPTPLFCVGQERPGRSARALSSADVRLGQGCALCGTSFVAVRSHHRGVCHGDLGAVTTS